MTTTLFSGGVVRARPEAPAADWLLIEDGVVVATGRTGDMPGADRGVDLEGATLLPGFCDAHVHLPPTGLYALGMDFRGEASAHAITAAYARRAAQGDGLLFGGNFEDPLDGPLSAVELDAAVGDRPAMLARADMHSCIVSSAILRQLDLEGLEGVDRSPSGEPTGYLREQAAGEAWRWFDAQLPEAQQRAAIDAAIQLAYSKGVTTVHEMYVVEWKGWAALEIIKDAAHDAALDVVFYVATPDVNRVRDMGLTRVGGDFFLDGSFGSHTAWLGEPYEETPPPGSPECGISYRSDAEVTDFFRAAQSAGMQAGVHAIGDAAVTQALGCLTGVAAEVGAAAVRRLGHRIEHFECSSDDHMRTAAELGVKISAQPAFDALWGGENGLYARRIGLRRAVGMNRFKSMVDHGLTVGAGSDSTVTPLDPWLQMSALRSHHVAGESVSAAKALELHTLGANDLAGEKSSKGSLEAGKRADVVMVDRDPITAEPDVVSSIEVFATWAAGTRVWPSEEAESQ